MGDARRRSDVRSSRNVPGSTVGALVTNIAHLKSRPAVGKELEQKSEDGVKKTKMKTDEEDLVVRFTV